MENDRAKAQLDRVLSNAQFKLLIEYLVMVVADADDFLEGEKASLENLRHQEIGRKVRKYDVFIVFGAICQLLFNFRPNANMAMDLVTGNFCVLKELLDPSAAVSFVQVKKVRAKCTLIEHVLENQYIGSVRISAHAWQRFFQRRDTRFKLIREYCEDFACAFERARPCELSPRVMIRRIISSDFERAHYLQDNVLGLRFVISDDLDQSGVRHLITIEQPK